MTIFSGGLSPACSGVVDCATTGGPFWQEKSYDHLAPNSPKFGRIETLSFKTWSSAAKYSGSGLKPAQNSISPAKAHRIEEARTNLIEALTLFFETADPSEISRRFRSEVFITQVEVPIG